MKILNKAVLSVALFAFCQNAISDQPQTPGKQVQCTMAESIMKQRLVESKGQVYTEKMIELKGLQISELGISEDSLELSSWGYSLDGEIYTAEVNGLVLTAYSINEAVSGPVQMKSIRIARLKPTKNEARFYDCVLTN